MEAFTTPTLWGAVAWSVLMAAMAVVILRKKVKPE